MNNMAGPFHLRWRNSDIIILVTSFFCLGQCVTQQKMTQSVHCPDLVLVSAHRYQVLRSRSLLECLTFCRPDVHCRSIVFDADQFFCHLANASSAHNCSNMEPAVGRMRFYEEIQPESGPASPCPVTSTETGTLTSLQSTTDKSTDTPTDTVTSTALAEMTTYPCQNGGELDGNGGCVCVDGTSGMYCENVIQDCTEGQSSGVYIIQPALSPSPFPVFCQMLVNPRTYILNHENRVFTFNRTWQDYRHGFGDVRGDFWLGLDKLHQLTNSKSYELRFRIKPGNTTFYSFYADFVINEEASGYTFSFGSYISNALQDCMSELQGAMFSTYDADNDDNSALNCAAEFGGGWWYSGTNCSACNILGPVLSEDGQRQGIVGEMFWSGFGDSYPLPLSAFLVVP